jgi:putative addiction module component (TIGR02574 family)
MAENETEVSPDARRLLHEALKLDEDERILLAALIWETVADEGPPLSDAERRLLDERLEEMRRNPDDLLTWEQVKERARTKAKAS